MDWQTVRQQNAKHVNTFVKFAGMGEVCSLRALTPQELSKASVLNKFGRTVYPLKCAVKYPDGSTVNGVHDFTPAQVDIMLDAPEHFFDDHGAGWGGKFQVLRKDLGGGRYSLEFELVK